MRTWILSTAVAAALIAAGCGDDDDDSADGAVDGGGGTGDNGGGGDGNGGVSGGDGGLNGTGGGGVVIGDGTQFAGCMDSMDCDPGLNCYTFGGYCSTQCGSDSDCTSLGANAGCYMPAGGGMGFPGIPGGAGGAAAGTGGAGGMTLAGTCRISCMGTDDTSCPTGLMCIDVGGGGGMAGTFRCALPGVDNGNNGGSGGNGGMMGTGGRGGMMQMPGTTPAFGQCQGGGCVEGLVCSSFGNNPGFCTQSCMGNGDCTNEPSSGSVTPTCGRAGRCVLPCTEDDESMCPDDMSCTVQGNGGGNQDGGTPATGRCNYSN